MGWPHWICQLPLEVSAHLLLNREEVGTHTLPVTAIGKFLSQALKKRNIMERQTTFEAQKTFCLYTSTLGTVSYYAYLEFHTGNQNVYVEFCKHVVPKATC